MSKGIGKTFAEGVRSLCHISSLPVLALAAIFSYLAGRSQTDVGEVAFAASITVLVFLLPAAGIVGPYLLAETKDALKIIATTHDQRQSIAAHQVVEESLRTIIDAAKPLQRGFAYTTLAVALSGLSLVHVKQIVDGVDIDRILAATSVALLVGTAAMIFPMTWQLLQLNQVESIYNILHTTNQAADSTVETTPPGSQPAAEQGQEAAAANGQPAE